MCFGPVFIPEGTECTKNLDGSGDKQFQAELIKISNFMQVRNSIIK